MDTLPPLLGSESLLAHLAARYPVDPAALAQVVAVAGERGQDALRLSLRAGLFSERDVAQGASELTGTPLLADGVWPAQAVLPDAISPRFLKEYGCLPIAADATTVTLAMIDPTSAPALSGVRLATGLNVVPVVALASEVEAAWSRLYGGAAASRHLGPRRADASRDETLTLRDLASEAPIVGLFDQLLRDAVDARASDIHLEPGPQSLRVRLRIDGVLAAVDTVPAENTAALISRIKLLAGLDIGERRLPQDGRIGVRVQGREIDLRVATLPGLQGESVTIRLLDTQALPLDLTGLGLDGASVAQLERLLAHPHGLILVTGPTGSGKSTTLYSVLRRLNSGARKIVTVEDPVEIQLEGVYQTQARPRIGFGFANALQSIMRHDPDIIMVGEIRDAETARMAVQAALTGHLVLSTLHTNDAASAPARLIDMGIEPFLLSASLVGVIAQRLVRRRCTACGGTGCPVCRGTGFKGRLALMEILEVDAAIAGALQTGADARVLAELATAAGMRSLARDGAAKVAAGLTALSEVQRVTGDG